MVAPRPLYLALAVLLFGSTFARPYTTYNSNNPSLYRRLSDSPADQLRFHYDEVIRAHHLAINKNTETAAVHDRAASDKTEPESSDHRAKASTFRNEAERLKKQSAGVEAAKAKVTGADQEAWSKALQDQKDADKSWWDAEYSQRELDDKYKEPGAYVPQAYVKGMQAKRKGKGKDK